MIGETLNRLLQEANISAYRLAQLTGIGHDSLSMYRNNKRMPNSKNLKRLAVAFGIPVDKLLGELKTD